MEERLATVVVRPGRVGPSFEMRNLFAAVGNWWENPTMANKVVLDAKRRGSFGSEFAPGDMFLREVSGDTITFRKLSAAEPPLVRARKVKGKWMGAKIELRDEQIVEAIRRDREAR